MKGMTTECRAKTDVCGHYHNLVITHQKGGFTLYMDGYMLVKYSPAPWWKRAICYFKRKLRPKYYRQKEFEIAKAIATGQIKSKG